MISRSAMPCAQTTDVPFASLVLLAVAIAVTGHAAENSPSVWSAKWIWRNQADGQRLFLGLLVFDVPRLPDARFILLGRPRIELAHHVDDRLWRPRTPLRRRLRDLQIIERCSAGFAMRDVDAVPDRPHLANNLFRSNDAAVYLVAGRDGTEKISTFVLAGFRSHNNPFSGNKVDWQNPLTWGRNLDLPLPQVQAFKDLHLEQGSFTAEPKLDKFGRSQAGCSEASL